MSRGPEASLWQTLRRGMGRRWHVQRHEDDLSSGIPDLSYALDGVDGWLELKARHKWPARTTLHALVPTQVQLQWMHARRAHGGGRVFVLLRAGHEWALVPPENAPGLARVRLTGELDALAAWSAQGPLTADQYDDLARALTGR